MTLNDILALIPMEDQWIYVFDTEGHEYYEGFKGNLELNEEGEELIVSGLYGNDTDTKDPNYGIVPTIEIEVKAYERLPIEIEVKADERLLG